METRTSECKLIKLFFLAIAPCVDPGNPVNGRRIGSVFVHDSVVQFQCYGDRFLKGSSEMKCDNGNWDAKLPTCIDCNGGIPLGMRTGDIPDESITASSQTAQHPAYLGRLGTDKYWCSSNEKTSHIEIRLPKRYKITKARVQITKNSENIRSIALLFEIFPARWIDYHYEKPPYNSDEKLIVPPKPFISQSLQIKIRKKKRVPVCLKAEVYGCEIPRGCIMQGSAVLTKKDSEYSKGYVGQIFKYGEIEVYLAGETRSTTKNRRDLILDEKAIVHDLVKGKTLVLGEDVNSPGSIRQGIIEQIGDSVCTIRSNYGTWTSKLDDIRLDEKSKIC